MDRNDSLVFVTSVLMVVWGWQVCRLWQSHGWKTVMYRLKTVSNRVPEVLTALAEGLDTFAALSASLSAAVRVFGHGEGTMRCWLARAGAHGDRLHERYFRDLWLRHVQVETAFRSTSWSSRYGAKVGTCGYGWYWSRRPS